VISDTMMKKAVHYTMMRQTVQWQDCYKRVLVMSARSTVAVLDCTAALSSLASWPVIGKNFTNRRVFCVCWRGFGTQFGIIRCPSVATEMQVPEDDSDLHHG
jgi:hypothetical protein